MAGVDIPQMEILGDRRRVASNSPKQIVAVTNCFEKPRGHPLLGRGTSCSIRYARRVRRRIPSEEELGLPSGGKEMVDIG